MSHHSAGRSAWPLPRPRRSAFTFSVGFGTEPAYAGTLNSVQLVVHNNGKPVTDIKDMRVGRDLSTRTARPTCPWPAPRRPRSMSLSVVATILGHGSGLDELVVFAFPALVAIGFWLIIRGKPDEGQDDDDDSSEQD